MIRAGIPVVGPGHPTVLSATRRLAGILLEQKRDAEAVELLSAAEPHARQTYTGSGQRNLALFLTSLGRARNRAGQYAAAEKNLLEANSIVNKLRGPAYADTLGSNKLLAEFYTAWDKAEPGKSHDAKAAEWKAKLPKEAEKPAEKN